MPSVNQTRGADKRSLVELPETYFDRWIGRKRSTFVTALLALILYGIAYAVGALEYGTTAVFTEGHWRYLFLSPSIIVYISVLAPWLSKLEVKANYAIAVLTTLDADELGKLVQETATLTPAQEIGAIVVGAGFGSFLTGPALTAPITPVNVVMFILTAATFGLLAWTIQASTISIKVTAALLRRPLNVNVFDLTPFDAIGQQSLVLALSFVGGITLSLVFTAFDPAMLAAPVFWLVNLPILLVPVAVFFLNMSPTHRIIAEAKKAELETVRQHIPRLAHRLLLHDDAEADDKTRLSTRFEALLAYEQRLQQVQTWPYDVSTLRKLFASFLLPVITVVAQVLLRMMLGG